MPRSSGRMRIVRLGIVRLDRRACSGRRAATSFGPTGNRSARCGHREGSVCRRAYGGCRAHAYPDLAGSDAHRTIHARREQVSGPSAMIRAPMKHSRRDSHAKVGIEYLARPAAQCCAEVAREIHRYRRMPRASARHGDDLADVRLAAQFRRAIEP